MLNFIDPFLKDCYIAAFECVAKTERKTIRRWLRREQFQKLSLPLADAKVADYPDHLHQRWNEGWHNATRLFMKSVVEIGKVQRHAEGW